jgi:hypothetical protein
MLIQFYCLIYPFLLKALILKCPLPLLVYPSVFIENPSPLPTHNSDPVAMIQTDMHRLLSSTLRFCVFYVVIG